VGKLDIEKYKVVSKDICTDDVIITDERVRHIKDRHPDDYERFAKYIPQIIADPGYILESDKPNTAFVLKIIEENGEKFQLILRLKVFGDPEEYLNSVITFLKIDEERYNRYLRTKKVLYKSE
jgi:hypothetical protein